MILNIEYLTGSPFTFLTTSVT